MNDLSSIGKEPTAIKIPVSKPPLDNSSPTKLKTCYMTGKAPWGFRITSTSSSGITPGILSLSNLVVVKVRARSKAYYAGLKEQDVILFINNQPSYGLTLETATELIESTSDLNLIISTNNNNGQKKTGGLLRSGSMCSIYSHRFDSNSLNNNINSSNPKSNSLRNINNCNNTSNTTDTNLEHNQTSTSNSNCSDKNNNEKKLQLPSAHEYNNINESNFIKDYNLRTDLVNSRLISSSTTQLTDKLERRNIPDYNNNEEINNTNNNNDYLIKPISLKTIRKLNINPITELHNKNKGGISVDNNLLNSLISPTNSTASTNSYLYAQKSTKSTSATTTAGSTSTSHQPPLPNTNNSCNSQSQHQPLTRLYNIPPKTTSKTKSSPSQQSNYKLEARQLAQKYRSSKMQQQGLTQRIYYSTDQEEDDLQFNRNKTSYTSNNQHNLPKSLSSLYSHNSHNINSSIRSNHNHNKQKSNSRLRAYYSATESFGEEESDYYPSEYESNNSNNKNITTNSATSIPKKLLPFSAYPPMHNFSYKKPALISSCSTTNLHRQQETIDNFIDTTKADANEERRPRDGGEEEADCSLVNRVSYATITLRQPLKDINYFSDTEAVHSGVQTQRGFKLKPASTHNLYATPRNNPSSSFNTANHNNLPTSNNYFKTNKNDDNKVPTNRASSLAYRNLTNKFLFNNNNNNSNHNKSSTNTSSSSSNPNPSCKNRTNTDLLVKRSESLFNSTNISNNSSQQLQPTFLDEKEAIVKTYHQPLPATITTKTTKTNAMSTSLSGFMKSNMLPEFPAHGDDSMGYLQSNYNSNPKGFVTSGNMYNNSMKQQQSSYTSMPFKWQPQQPQQLQQPQQPHQPQQPQQQYQQYQPQQQYQEEYQESSTPKPDPQEIFARSLAQSRNEQNDYLAAMQRNDEYEEDEEYRQYVQSIGTGLFGSKKDKPKYSDSYFYNSPDMKYPTINQQKELARTIASTLEGSNAATSKYHKKKETINRQFNDEDNYEESLQSNGYYSSQQSYNQSSSAYSQLPVQVLPSNIARDDNIPDVIKRSIAQAQMTNPLSNVQAPEYFKEAHFTETSSHTECSPSGAISLAAALDGHKKGGKGQTLFQKRKARMDKLSENEEVRQQQIAQQQQHYAAFQQQYGQQQQQQQQQQQAQQLPTPQSNFLSQQFMTPLHFQHKPKPQPVQQKQPQYQQQQQPQYQQQQQQQPQYQQQYQQVQQQEESHYQLPNIASNVSTSKFSNFNIKPRGWGAVSAPTSTSTVQPAVSTFEMNPMSPRQAQQQAVNAPSRTSINIVSSHDNHLFNSRNAQQNISYQQQPQYQSHQPQQPHQSTVQFTIAQPNQMPKQQLQQRQPEAPKVSSYNTGPIQYQIYNEEEIAASDL